VQRPEVQAMMRKIKFFIDPEAEAAGFDKMTSIIKITLQNGSVIRGRAIFGKGSPANPMSFDETATKFRGCAEYAQWPATSTEAIISAVAALESLSDVRHLAPLLSAKI
jgi:2-methylcitrate dehydratase PrpD